MLYTPFYSKIFQKSFRTDSNSYSPYSEGASSLTYPTVVIYKFRFTSLIAPYLLTNLRLDDITLTPSTALKSTMLLKQSYLLFTWFYYLKESRNISKSSSKGVIKFTFLPTRHKNYTLTKAPMAHKTNSKEQFTFRFFNFNVSIKTRLNQASTASSFDQTLLTLFVIKESFPFFETNLLFLKTYTVLLNSFGGSFFNYSLPLRL